MDFRRFVCVFEDVIRRCNVRRVLLAALVVAAVGCNDRAAPVLAELMQARSLASELLVRVTNSADAGNRAVMAETDEASLTFAHEAEQETRAAQSDVDRLATLLQSLKYRDELGLLEEFRAAFDRYRALDQEVLALAVENTNLKAQRLAFGEARAAADAFGVALESAAGKAPASSAWHVLALTQSAVSAVREIEVLQGPHIAAAEDSAMARLEEQMGRAEAEARRALTEAGSVAPELAAGFEAANAALSRFLAVNSQVVALSRRNTNVRSLGLALGRKRSLTGACEGKLRALSDRLEKHEFRATR